MCKEIRSGQNLNQGAQFGPMPPGYYTIDPYIPTDESGMSFHGEMQFKFPLVSDNGWEIGAGDYSHRTQLLIHPEAGPWSTLGCIGIVGQSNAACMKSKLTHALEHGPVPLVVPPFVPGPFARKDPLPQYGEEP